MSGTTLLVDLDDVLVGARTPDSLIGRVPRDWRDALGALARIHALHTAPLESLIPGSERYQHAPELAGLKVVLEAQLVERFDRMVETEYEVTWSRAQEVAAGMRILAAAGLVHPIYEWVAGSATLDEIVEFVTVEGGPDADFDDLVAICQVGLSGPAKVALGANYWDEMGGGDGARVHTVLHDQLVRALGVRSIPRDQLPIEALERSALNGLLATNRALQPEMLGALGLLEMQAGPRCRKVVQGLQRAGAPLDALPFYEEHAHADPRHGKAWLDGAVLPLVGDHPEWAPRILRGAQWRAVVNHRLFDELLRRFRSARPVATVAA